ncbi:MAG TPA: DUF1593 domain-containing protein [Candidatus Saccharimonadales bacterium]|nr:DUF1593 domain-containing protein [Candidatus Saccharimonadales bacterium]
MPKLASILVLIFTLAGAARAQDKCRVFVLTDISNEPDDEESLVRFLVYANEFDVEGLAAVTSTWLKTKTREDLIRRDLAAYAEVRTNLLKHAPGFPAAEQLLAVTTSGQPGYGMGFVGPRKSSGGSQLIIDAADKPDARPLWITIWGGANTLAQALTDVRAARNADELKKFVSKLRVYSISDQDDAGAWLRKEFSGLFYVVSPSTQDGKEYWRATWTGISGERRYKNGPLHKFNLVDNPWLEEHIIKNHGPLGALYPRLAYIMEGDTPSFLGLINHGLGWEISPAYGGWGGRYVFYQPSGETRPIWSNNADSRDTVTADTGETETSDQATIWRWREQYQNDFAARMNWCVAADFTNANHNPIPVLNGDRTKNIITISATSGATVSLTGEGTSDPDGNSVRMTWWIYPEAGNIPGASLTADEGLKTQVHLPQTAKRGKLHVVLQVTDDGNPPLSAYRRAIIEVAP